MHFCWSSFIPELQQMHCSPHATTKKTELFKNCIPSYCDSPLLYNCIVITTGERKQNFHYVNQIKNPQKPFQC